MKEKKSLLLLLYFLFLVSFSATSQDLGNYSATGRGGVATTFATDYQTAGINPANLGFRKSFRDPTYTLGLFELNTTIFAEALSRTELLNAIFRSSNAKFNFQNFDEKSAAADKIANSNLSLSLDATIFGASARLKGGHSLAFAIRDRIQFFGTVNQTAAEIAFLGYNASYFPELLLSNGRNIPNPRNPENSEPALSEAQQQQVVLGGFLTNPDSASFYSNILEGTRLSSSWYREYNVSYGRKLYESYDFSLFAGVGVKLIRGFLLIDVEAQNGVLDPSIISISPTFGVDFGEGDGTTAQSPTFQSPQDVSTLRKILFPKKVGGGYGFDFGLTAVIKQNLYIGAALTNFGRITWDGNVYQVNDGQLVNFAGAGLDNYNIFGASEGAFQFAGDKSPLSWEGTDKIVEDLPSTFRLGASYEFFRTFHFGVDFVAPTNRVAGNLDKVLVAIGGDFRPSKLFRVSAGLNAGGNNGGTINFPVGLTYLARRGFYEAGIATRDITTYFANIGDGSTFSFALGFARVKF